MSRIERWRWVVLDAELDCLGGRLARNLRYDTESKIDPRSDASCGDHMAVFYDPCFLVCRPDERQEIGIGPMCRHPSPLEQSGNTENERAGANGGDILRATSLPADEIDGLLIGDGPDDTAHPTRNANQIEGWTVRESMGRYEAQSTITGHGGLGFGDDVGCRVRQPGEDLQWGCKVELRQLGENHEADIEG